MNRLQSPRLLVEDPSAHARDFRVVLVMQGGGALGAYYGGIYQALHEAGLEPDWVIGASIGAISGAIIVGNAPGQRLPQLRAFWEDLVPQMSEAWTLLPPVLRRHAAKHLALFTGVPGFYVPNVALALGWQVPVGLEYAALYSSEPLRQSLLRRIDLNFLNQGAPRFSFALVHVANGTLQYCDNRENEITIHHILAASAMPPSFAPVRINGEAFWDSGFYDNTPLQVAFDDPSDRTSIVFAPNLWPRAGAEPQSLAQAWNRQKCITFTSRVDDQVARHKELRRLRQIIAHVIGMLPDDKREILQEMNLGEHTEKSLIHLVELNARGPECEDPLSDIDFSRSALHQRWDQGYEDTRRVIDERPWEEPVSPFHGISIHNGR
jgi:NTE family protein